MRDLEWKTLLQTYAGYGAIAVAFQNAMPSLIEYGWWVRLAFMVVTLCFFIKMHYLHFRIQERLITFDENYFLYINKVLGGRDEHEERGWGLSKLGHQYFWTYDTQTFLGTLTGLAMLVYQGILRQQGDWGRAVPLKIILELVVFGGFLRACLQMRRRRLELIGLLDYFRKLRQG
jgi:hypothetical protein